MTGANKLYNRPVGSRAGNARAWLFFGIVFGLLTGCATGPGGEPIYVPVGGDERESGQERRTPESREETRAPGSQEEQQPQRQEQSTPSHRTEGQSISPAAAGLVKQADQAFRAGNVDGGMALLQRAQRISPDASAIYYKMAEGYVLGKKLPRAEQFATKGISVAGSNQRLQKSGWQLLSDIRRARGNVAGADTAEERASSL